MGPILLVLQACYKDEPALSSSSIPSNSHTILCLMNDKVVGLNLSKLMVHEVGAVLLVVLARPDIVVADDGNALFKRVMAMCRAYARRRSAVDADWAQLGQLRPCHALPSDNDVKRYELEVTRAMKAGSFGSPFEKHFDGL